MTEDMIRYRYNTALATLMEYLNYLNTKVELGMLHSQWHYGLKTFTLLLSPLAPFIVEEVWQNVLGFSDSVHKQVWPSYDEAKVKESTVMVVVQVNGRVRDKLEVESGITEESLQNLALCSAKIQSYLTGREVRRIIVVPDRLVNIVV